ncbi:MAG: ribosome-associated translation inhibitor RaiA [Hoeflea sp.]|uniref:ribosome hibernation-promoting factor, HPF/YfiA family n=1 Tax=Hoeflea sp. TaxID=1940281 RepID=UPI001DA0E7CD|nr:ribosome-associated translation inhibitor RaiA [Hoeflea sp.]MBU4531415.1 ribosome-associated translation inhibitor RaiA [Alphaproteobacteria bacterium]MBU4544272.1 ribosome-associated translation inhibitor RaiA [Alphaproteobacteria bacterium]MBU4550491.1 ribosome-associated translation inhibitor RaiA [Alphaproteobacteria bacterium]MBV1724691.1 ribosome-associated translation inhibitor RaiA [Hoeflea sp.]MBV1760711.1 ribosome-associated translation inhibitor RaiA [Hoeflea sp.]
MSVRVSGKHMEIGESFRTRIEDQITGAVRKYYDGGFSSHVIVEKSGSRFTSDCKIHLDTGVVLHATGEAQDPQPAFDAAAERVEKRLRRYKRRLKDHYANGQQTNAELAYAVVDSATNDDADEVPTDYAPAIIAESTKQLVTMSVAHAVMALDMTDERILMFRNAGNDALNVVYRRDDGNIGWIDAGGVKA